MHIMCEIWICMCACAQKYISRISGNQNRDFKSNWEGV